ncbi:hypothetical protein AB0I93_15855 [Streptomyces sp. NPDC049967]|uniref:hypothetical protein n=1 Tax=unclassified Streptomyces TaxID=2593676 RepID=UPI002E29F05E|nr:hypothetical protein [Streptomyces sp. NBC_00342]
MPFEEHIDGPPGLLPHREQGEALLAINEATPELPSEAGIDLFAVPAGEVRGSGFDLSRFHRLSRLPAAGNPAPPVSPDNPQDAA